MRAFLIATVGFVIFVVAVKLFATGPKTESADTAAASAATLAGSEDDKALYALGVAVSQNIASFEFSTAELDKVKQ
ncbi:MAG: hypothetical protein JNL55_16895, partial [Steroidobacter sp.]